MEDLTILGPVGGVAINQQKFATPEHFNEKNRGQIKNKKYEFLIDSKVDYKKEQCALFPCRFV